MRPGAMLLVLFLAVAALVAGQASAARADFATQCAAPTRTQDPTASEIRVDAGEVVLVATSFTGGIDALPAGGTLCVGPGAALVGFYMNNAAGAMVVAAGGSLVMPSVVVAAGFSLDVEGTASFAGLGVNGSSDVRVAPDASMTIGSGFSPSAGAYVNEGTFVVEGAMNLNSGVTFENAGTLTVHGETTVNSLLRNSGSVEVGGGLTINGSGALQNSCAVTATGSLMNNGRTSSNAGLVQVGQNFTNNGIWEQSSSGLTTAVELADDGSVGGFGGYQFSGTTRVQGRFVGSSAADPIRVQTMAPSGQIFDVETGTIDNVMRTSVAVLAATPICLGAPAPDNADVEVSKTGPATVLVGGTIQYSLHVHNLGPSPAADVVVSDTLPVGFTLDPKSTTGTLDGNVLSWSVGTLAAGEVRDLSFAGSVTVGAGSTLLNVASSTSSTIDTVPANNDGSADAARVSTQVVDRPPPANRPPVADDLVLDTVTGDLLPGSVTASDPEGDSQRLTYEAIAGPADGVLDLTAGGGFVYHSDLDFAGIDGFGFQVCDNAAPVPACDTGTVTINVYPRANDDVATTTQDTPVVIPVLSNDSDGAPLDAAPVSAPSRGTVALDPTTGDATYTPAEGFTGTDTFTYRICSPATTPPPLPLCDTALVTVTVDPPNAPPTIEPLTLVTTTGTPVTGTLVVADPDAGDTLVVLRGIPPRSGNASVQLDGSTTYAPQDGFAGRDFYGAIVCDDGAPRLCATARVTVEVSPVAEPDTATTTEGTGVDIDLSGNDRGAVAPPTVTSGPSHGTVTIDGGTAHYVPEAGFTGTDTFEYTICAAIADDLCATTTVTVTVTAGSTPTPTPLPPTPLPPTPLPPTPGPPIDNSGVLATTGANSAPVGLLGLALVLTGGLLVLLRRRGA